MAKQNTDKLRPGAFGMELPKKPIKPPTKPPQEKPKTK